MRNMKSHEYHAQRKKGTFASGVCYSRLSVFDFTVVFLNFRRYLRSVLFPNIVKSFLHVLFFT